MKVTMNDSRLTNINQLQEFLKGSKRVEFSLKYATIEEKYQFVKLTVNRLKYWNLRRKEKRVVVKYLKKITGYKPAQLYRLIGRASKGELIRKEYKRVNPNRKYTSMDIKLLEQTDEYHLRLNGLATKEILRRECELFGQEEYQNISEVSVSHITNLRKSPIYKNSYVNHTHSRIVKIGETKEPENNDIPGSIRIDTVNQRGIYYINAVDEIVQWELVISVEVISEKHLMPALEYILEQYPFIVFNFHSDRGSEFINHKVVKLLNKLLIHQTKSRSRHSNDNALVEGKNGSVIRKNLGYGYLPKNIVGDLNKWLKNYFNIYLNYHRPCLFQTGVREYSNGRKIPIYGEAKVPYEKLKQVSEEKERNFLKPEITFDELDKIAYKHSDNAFAKQMREAESELFENTLALHLKFGSRRKPKS